MADAGAHEGLVGVGRVNPGDEGFSLADIEHVGAAQAEEGPQVGDAPFDAHGRHARQGARAGAAAQAEQHGFRLVVEGVAEEHGAGAGRLNSLLEGGVAGGACRHFGAHVADGNLHFFGDDGVKPQVGEGLRGLRGNRGGVFLQAVIDDDGAHAHVAAAGEVRGDGCQREGVGAAAAGDQEQGQVGGVRLGCGAAGAGASGGFDASGAEELFEGGGEVSAGGADGRMQASCASILHGGSFIEIAKCLCR